MRMIFKKHTEVTVNNGKKWYPTSIFAKFVYLEENDLYKDEDIVISNFAQLQSVTQQGRLPNAELGKTFFTKEDCVRIYGYPTLKPCRFTITEKNLMKHNIIISNFYAVPELSFEDAKVLLSPQDFCQFLKDNKISTF